MSGANRGRVANKPLTANGKPTQSLHLGETRGLQQGQAAAAGTDKDELGTLLALFSRGAASQGEMPLTRTALKSGYLPSGCDAALLLIRQPATQTAGQQAVVHLGAIARRGCDGSGLAAFHHQRSPLMDRRRIRGERHAAEEMVLGHRSVAGPQKVHVL